MKKKKLRFIILRKISDEKAVQCETGITDSKFYKSIGKEEALEELLKEIEEDE